MAVRWPKRRGESSSGVTTTNEQNTNYTLVLADANNIVLKASGGAGETFTIPANSAVPYDVGTLIAISNDGGGDLTVAITTDTLEGTDGSTGSRTLSDNNGATIEKLTSTKWRYTATDGSGTSAEYASFYASSAGNTNVTTTEQQATLNATLVNSDASIFTLSSSTVTVNKTAVYKITYDLTVRQDSDTGDSRSTIDMWVDVDAVEVAGSRTGFYTRGFEEATSGHVSLIESITSGEAVTFRWQCGSGGDDLDEVANAIRATFVEMV